MRLGDLPPAEVARRLRGEGLGLDLSPVAVRVRSPLGAFADQLAGLYADFDVRDAAEPADIDVRLLPAPGVRRLFRRQVLFVVDGVLAFEPFPRDHALPLFEWGLNWCFLQRMHTHLLLHAGVVERDGRAVLLPAWPGSGKSTLSASLAERGWRYLSDEFGVVDTTTADVLPFVRPAGLKNVSIDVIRAFAPGARFGPTFPNTRKGTVAHLRPPADSVARRAIPASVAAIVFPDFQAGAALEVTPLGPSATFLKLAGNAFNYELVGERAFAAVAQIVRGASSQILRYGSLDDAHAALERIVSDSPR